MLLRDQKIIALEEGACFINISSRLIHSRPEEGGRGWKRSRWRTSSTASAAASCCSNSNLLAHLGCVHTDSVRVRSALCGLPVMKIVSEEVYDIESLHMTTGTSFVFPDAPRKWQMHFEVKWWRTFNYLKASSLFSEGDVSWSLCFILLASLSWPLRFYRWILMVYLLTYYSLFLTPSMAPL